MYNVRKTKKRKYGTAFLVGVVCLMLAGCAEGQEEADDIVVIDHPEEAVGYVTAKAALGDVVKTARIRCVYVQTQEEELSLGESGKWVEEVYVSLGDDVEEGELLAVFSGGDREAELRELEHQIARNKLLLEFTDTDESHELSYRWWVYFYQTSMTEKDEEQLQESLESIQQKYRYLREDYQDAIDLDTLKAETLQEQMKESRLYANMDGTVTYLYNADLTGRMLVQKDEVLIRIADNSSCFFETTQNTYADCFSEGQVLELTLDSGSSQTSVDVIPHDMEHWGDKLYFEAVDGDGGELEAGAGGSILITVDKRQQVLAVPKEVLHTAGEKYYVYVEGEDRLREVRWVEVGLAGDQYVEIVNGLSEGEEVIMK